MSLEQLMAFAVSTDHARQEQVWDSLQRSCGQEPYQIRRMLTERTAQASDKRALFIGVEAYEKAGGSVTRDLFQDDHGGFLEDVALLDRLVAEKLKAEAETVAAEGWKWIEAAVDFPYGVTNKLRQLDGAPKDLTVDEQSARDALKAERARLEARYQSADELPDDVQSRLEAIETALAAFDDRPLIYDPADLARAGAYLCIDADGRLTVDRGYVRPQDEVPAVDGDGKPSEGAAPPPAGARLSRLASRLNRSRTRTMSSSRCLIASSAN